jgi:hypothetical protein
MRVVAFDIGLKNFAFAVMDDGQHLVSMDVHDLRGQDLYYNLVCYLKQYTYLWNKVDVVLIEQQLNRMNIQATKLACHVHAYFLHCHPSIPVLEYPSLYKTKYTCFPLDHSTHRQRKQYAIQQVLEQYQQDPVFLDWISNFPKKDDVCDCILMCRTFPSTPLYRNYCLTFLSTGRSHK